MLLLLRFGCSTWNLSFLVRMCFWSFWLLCEILRIFGMLRTECCGHQRVWLAEKRDAYDSRAHCCMQTYFLFSPCEHPPVLMHAVCRMVVFSGEKWGLECLDLAKTNMHTNFQIIKWREPMATHSHNIFHVLPRLALSRGGDCTNDDNTMKILRRLVHQINDRVSFGVIFVGFV